MPINLNTALPLGLSAVSGLLNNLPSARTARQRTNTLGTTTGTTSNTATGQTTGTQSGTTTIMPVEAPGYQSMGQLLRDIAQRRLLSGFDTAGLEASGIQNINQAYRGVGQAVNADLTRRGLAASPIAGTATTNLQTSRAGDIAGWLNQLPELRRQMEAEDIGIANQIYSQRPLGSTTTTSGTTGTTSTQTGGSTTNQTTTQTGTGDTTGPGSTVGGTIDSVGKMLGYLQAGGDLAKIAGAGGILGGLGSVLGGGGGAVKVAADGTVFAAGGGGALGSLGATIGALATNPITWAVAAGLAALVAFNKIGQGRKAANEWVQGQDGQNQFDKAVGQVNDSFHRAAQAGQLTSQQAQEIRTQIAQQGAEYLARLQQFAGQGGKRDVVAEQALATFNQQYGPAMSKTLSAMDNVIAQLRAQGK